jgi:hypothetical protein
MKYVYSSPYTVIWLACAESKWLYICHCITTTIIILGKRIITRPRNWKNWINTYLL